MRFTDAEFAVIVDSLAQTRDRIAGPTPNIDSALAKFNANASPKGCAFVAFWGEDADLLYARGVSGGHNSHERGIG